ncbi:hypothetical protein TorRG33x02_027680 [Trema orientale]|uniref:Uncharacterized protein n=1 Tax=Trema orientale TaxID=63057 RepID=A0A2P5FUJ5_TREOI|nr:hypothetical protein TorRG33x02_027680 [Trema orientale]
MAARLLAVSIGAGSPVDEGQFGQSSSLGVVSGRTFLEINRERRAMAARLLAVSTGIGSLVDEGQFGQSSGLGVVGGRTFLEINRERVKG